MEDTAVPTMPLSHSAPLYLFFDVPAWEEYWLHGGGFELAAAGAKSVRDGKEGSAAPRACASDVSRAFADELFRGGALLPLRLPPRLQHPADWSAAASLTGQRLGRVPSWSPFTGSSRRHRGSDPFAAALEKVRRDRAAPAPARRRARSLSPVRGAAVAAKSINSSRLAVAGTQTAAARQKTGERPLWRSTSTRRRGVKHLLCLVVMASSDAAAPRDLRTRRRRDGGAPHGFGFLICFGF